MAKKRRSRAEASAAIATAEGYFAAEDDRFVEALRLVEDSQQLAAFATTWGADGRSWAQRQQLNYLRSKPNCIGHQPVIKRLFKRAESDANHPVMAACAALFDRIVRHQRKTRYRYDWRSGSSWQEDYLAAQGAALPYGRKQEGINPFTGEPIVFHAPPPGAGATYFSYRTRYYLQRRAWRYFRRLALASPEQYVDAALLVLREYTDADFDRGERLLDSWTLMQMAFREHPALEFGRERVRVAEGGSLSQLQAAPRFRHLWQTGEAFDHLIALMTDAPSRLVRVWAMQLIEEDHGERVAQLPASALIDWLESRDEDIRRFAIRLLKTSRGVRDLPIEKWLELIDRVPPEALPDLCDVVATHAKADDLSLQDCVELALRQPSSVAELGLKWLKAKQAPTEDDHEQLARLADVRCFAIAEEAADFALEHVGSQDDYDRDLVSRFFDSLQPGVRRRAKAWLEAEQCPGANDPVLFSRLLETPFDDLRLAVIDLLEKRTPPGEARDGLATVWASVLLGVHRGGRQKLKATRQLAAELVAHPEQADKLLPVLAAAVRSVRGPESRAGLAAVVASLATRPELAEAIARHLPELQLLPAEAPA
ncbi:MAG: hypothetical protein AAGJ46_02490 [Planctomycetota bacterium]